MNKIFLAAYLITLLIIITAFAAAFFIKGSLNGSDAMTSIVLLLASHTWALFPPCQDPEERTLHRDQEQKED